MNRDKRLNENERAFYFDKKGKRIYEFAVLKVFHYVGVRNKRFFMYKWARIKSGYWIGQHLVDGTESSYWLKSCANGDGKLKDTEIVQCYGEDAPSSAGSRKPRTAGEEKE